MKKIYLITIGFLSSIALSAQAPVQLIDINAGTGNSSPSNLFVFNNKIFFSADDSSGTNTGGVDLGREPWISDGTAANTNLLLNIRSGTGNSAPFNIFTFNGALYFTANDGAAELWTTDLTAAGTTKVDLFPSISGDVPNNAVVLNNVVYLTTNQPNGNSQLTEWDGTNAAQVAPNAAGNSEITVVSEIATYNNLLFLYMETTTDEPTTGRELYSYDPSTDTYALIKDINPGNANAGISGFTVANGILYFEALGQLWKTDGVTANTIQVPAAETPSLTGVNNLYSFNGDLLFEAQANAATGDQLYILDTATGVIVQISNISGNNINHDPSDYVTLNNFVYYAGKDGNDTASHLFRTDGITTTQLDDTIIDIDDLVVLGGLIYMEGDNGTDGNELFVFNPTTASLEAVNKSIVRMYPNPSKGALSFSGDVTADASFIIYDLSGRNVLNGKLVNNQLTHGLKSGIYFVEIQQENITDRIKLIVE